MPLLYSLHLSRHINGFGKPSVRSVQAMLAGHQCSETRETVRPDATAVRDALPHYYRKAFDRTGGMFWFSSEADKPAHLTLRDRRGRYLNTVYALPYQFA